MFNVFRVIGFGGRIFVLPAAELINCKGKKMGRASSTFVLTRVRQIITLLGQPANGILMAGRNSDFPVIGRFRGEIGGTRASNWIILLFDF